MNPFSLAQKKLHNLSDLTNEEFEKIVFAGATMAETRGPSDAFTVKEMQVIINSDSFYFFPQYSKDFLWAAYANEADRILEKVRENYEHNKTA